MCAGAYRGWGARDMSPHPFGFLNSLFLVLMSPLATSLLVMSGLVTKSTWYRAGLETLSQMIAYDDVTDALMIYSNAQVGR